MRIHPDFARFATATDAGKLVARLGPDLARRLGGETVDDLQVTRVLPRKQGGYTIQYQVQLGEGVDLYLCGHLLGENEAMPAYAEQASPAVIRDDELGLIVPVFPFDPRLEALPEICSAAGAAELLGEPDAPASATVLAYRLEKRCVIRCESAVAGEPSRRVVAKVVPRSRLPRFVDGHRKLQAAIEDLDVGGEITVPRILRVIERLGVYAMEEVPGRSLYEIRVGGESTAAYAAAGRALRQFHTLPHPENRVRTFSDELAQLDSWIARIAPMFPDVAASFIACGLRVRDGAASAGRAELQTTLVHGDFYDKQVHHAPERTTILDTDNLTGGDPAQDIGNFSAHVRLRQLQDPRRAAALTSCLQAFESAYGDYPRDIARRVVWWRSATLLRLAGLYALRPRWRHLVPSLLENVDSCVRSGAAVR